MRRYIRLIFVAALFAAAFSCEREPVFEPYTTSDRDLCLDFSYTEFDEIEISTKSTLPSIVENRVVNVFALIFDQEGDLVYGNFYDENDRKDSLNFIKDVPYSWYVDVRDPNAPSDGTSTEKNTWGSLNLQSPSVENGTLYLIANLETDYLNLSSSNLQMVNNIADLEKFIIRYQEPTTESTGSFLMIGSASISIDADNKTYSLRHNEGDSFDQDKNRVLLKRLHSKINVKIGIVPGAVTDYTFSFTDEDGNTQTQVARQVIEKFTPVSWQVMSLPNGSNLLEKPDGPDASLFGGHFDSAVNKFETSVPNVRCDGYDRDGKAIDNAVRTEYGFSFYMLEHKSTRLKHKSVYDSPDEGISKYHYRDRRTKNADGSLARSGDQWEYAPECGTYLIVKGDIAMRNDATATSSQVLNANATYYIHLGNFGSSLNGGSYDNYDIERGKQYNYTINIKGVDKILVEVELDSKGFKSDNEKQSGATGSVFIASEEVRTFDSHFEQRVFRFNYDKIKSVSQSNNVTWYVSTPFGRKGTPDRVGPDRVEVPNGLDYKWIHFLVNSKEAEYVEKNAGPGGADVNVANKWYPNYCRYNRRWPEGGKSNPELMDIIGLTSFLRTNVQKKDNGEDNAFDAEGNIYVTTFVDEFFYDLHPITGEPEDKLWQKFVNQPMRVMHIFCEGSESLDGQSSTLGSVITIQQNSIQSIYSREADQAWGGEFTDETKGGLFFFSADETRTITDTWSNRTLTQFGNPPNYERNNGLYNSCALWGLLSGDVMTSWNDPVSRMATWNDNVHWGDYLDYSRENDYHYKGNPDKALTQFLVDEPEKATLRYTCMQRNRDENGDGIIDQNEIKWYMASSNQLRMLFIGDIALQSAAKLYYMDEPSQAQSGIAGNAYYLWRCHVISSSRTITNNQAYPEYLWAEEGTSVGRYGTEGRKNGELSVRCVRNLPKLSSARQEFNPCYPDSYPRRIGDVKKNDDGTYTFDLSRLNNQAKRIRSDFELVPMDENSPTSRPYRKFQTGPLGNGGADLLPTNGTANDYRTKVQQPLLRGRSFCPDGYRMPNVREATLMYTFIDTNNADFWTGSGGMLVCNYYSFGSTTTGGNGFDTNGIDTWRFNSGRGGGVSISKGNGYVRCVKDVD